ncbi:Imm50 family immunity protein [Streptomyces sp. NPDC002394]
MTDSLTLVNPEGLVEVYGEIPPLHDFRPRSINLNWRGPTVTLRGDLSTFPATVPPEWEAADVDKVQCHLQFLAVEDFSLKDWEPPIPAASFFVESLGERRRIRVRMTGVGVDLDFTSSDSVLVGHVSAFKSSVDGTDEGRHLFTRKLDSFRYETIPSTEEKTFYGRL